MGRAIKMDVKLKIAIVALVVFGVVVTSAVVVASTLEMFIFTENLDVEEFEATGINGNARAADVLDHGARVANIYVRVEPQLPGAFEIPMLVSIWHSEDTEVDYLFLKISGTQHIDVYLEAPAGYPWPLTSFQQSTDGKGAVFEVNDMGIQGTGTVTLQFLMRTFSQQNSFYFEAKFTMHKEAIIQLTRQQASTYTDIPMPT
jgi:hypothetical protein